MIDHDNLEKLQGRSEVYENWPSQGYNYDYS